MVDSFSMVELAVMVDYAAIVDSAAMFNPASMVREPRSAGVRNESRLETAAPTLPRRSALKGMRNQRSKNDLTQAAKKQKMCLFLIGENPTCSTPGIVGMRMSMIKTTIARNYTSTPPPPWKKSPCRAEPGAAVAAESFLTSDHVNPL